MQAQIVPGEHDTDSQKASRGSVASSLAQLGAVGHSVGLGRA